MKKTKIIVPALGMLLLSTAASVTGTVAWFAVNTSVSVSGLQVKAKAEGGIVIAAYTHAASSISDSGVGYNNTLADATFTAPEKSAYKNEAAVNLTAAELFPTSTYDTSAWHHATSNDVNNHAATSAYSTFGTSLQKDGKNYTGTGDDSEHAYAYDGQYFLYNQYRVKSTNDSTFSLYVSAISVSAETSASEAINNSLRVAIKVGDGAVAFFAPLYTTSEGGDLKCSNGSTAVAYTRIAKGKGELASKVQIANDTINSTGIDMKMWVYYEGEDPNCKTVNTDGVTIDSLSIGVTFTTIA